MSFIYMISKDSTELYFRLTLRSGKVYTNCLISEPAGLPPALSYFADISKEMLLGLLDVAELSNDEIDAGIADFAQLEILDSDKNILDSGWFGEIKRLGSRYYTEVSGLRLNC